MPEQRDSLGMLLNCVAIGLYHGRDKTAISNEKIRLYHDTAGAEQKFYSFDTF